MDVVARILGCISTWDAQGQAECRDILLSIHSNSSPSGSTDSLATSYHTLLHSCLSTWSGGRPLFPTQALVACVRSVSDALPSTSAGPAKPSVESSIFADVLLNAFWSLSADLDEIIDDSKRVLLKDSTADDVAKAEAKEAWNKAQADKQSLADALKGLLAPRILSPDACRERLDPALLARAGLIADESQFGKKEVRARTAYFFKQNKFNLLREQSEGYSKLITELMSSLGPPHASDTGRPVEDAGEIRARVLPTWERVVSLIGYFDLDPNRALDIILDVFATNLLTHYSFFIELLSCSPWGSVSEGMDHGMDMHSRCKYKGKTLDEVLRIAEITSNEGQDVPSPPELKSGDTRVLAQVLGFKFCYYQLPDTPQPTPQSLYFVAALLIRNGFISLEDLLAHITPTEDDMEIYRKKYLASIDERISGAKSSLLAMAAPLESTGASSKPKASPAAPAEQKPTKNSEPPNQRLGLLTALLSVGALRPGFALLSQFPWMVDAYSEVADLLIRVLKHSIGPLSDSTFPAKERNSGFSQARARYGTGARIQIPIRKTQLTIWAPIPPGTNAIDYVFFFPDWSERVPLCTVSDDLMDVIEPLMRFVGLHVYRDTIYLTKLLRLGRTHLSHTVTIDPETKKPVGDPDPEHPVRKFWHNFLRMYLIPAISLIRGNAVCTVEVWNLLRQYDTTLRWQLYGEWKTSMYQSHPELRVRQVQADREAKGILRRLSLQSIDALAGPVAKLTHSNPTIFFANAVNQVMAYDNMAGVVIQALRHSTNMGFDVLVYIVMDALANPNKERVKDDGVNTSDWLQSLASFTGMLYRRFSADLLPLLKYLVHQLYDNKTTEIVVLRELIWKMAGIEPLPSLSDAQVAAMGGGPALRIEAVASSTRGARQDPGEVHLQLRGPQRLGRVLVESGLAMPLVIQVAQQRQSCVFRTDAHLKSLANLYDATHGVLLQYLEFLTTPTYVSTEDYASKVIPSLADMYEKYGLCAPICMQMIRPVLARALMSAALAHQEQERQANEEAEKRLKAALTAKREPVNDTSRVASPVVDVPTRVDSVNKATPTEQPVEQPTEQNQDVPMDVVSAVEEPWVPELRVLFDDVQKIASTACAVLGPAFYLTFWQMSLYDISPPTARYEEETNTLRTLSRKEDSLLGSAERSMQRSIRATAHVHRQKRDRYNSIVAVLNQELKDQAVARAFTIKRLVRERAHWFAGCDPNPTLIAATFVEQCLQPRCLLSPMDADYCSQIIKVIHAQGNDLFHTLRVYNVILGNHIHNVIFSCSEYEARNYGRFLMGVLSDLWKWFQDEQLYTQDCRTRSGGKVVLLPGFRSQWSAKRPVAPSDLMGWGDIKLLLRKFHRKLKQCFVDCIQTGEFMHVYNGIIVLKEILPVFPCMAVLPDCGTHINHVIDAFLERETRGDLKILGKAYHASLQKRKSFWAPPSAASAPAKRAPASKSTGSIPASNGTTANGLPTVTTQDSANTTSTPTAPRAQNANGLAKPEQSSGPPAETKLTIDSIPRPEVVKRVRQDAKSRAGSKSNTPQPTTPLPTTNGDPMDIDQEKLTSSADAHEKVPPTAPKATNGSGGIARLNESLDGRGSHASSPAPMSIRTDVARREPAPSPRHPRALDERSRGAQSPMPPPTNPSQTVSAQELRDTAKQTVGFRGGVDQADDESRAEPDSRALSGAMRRRSNTPPSRPRTRTSSADSRASGGPGRDADDKRTERDQRGRRGNARDPDRRDRETSYRPRDRDVRDGDRDRDRTRDRHAEREVEPRRGEGREREKEREGRLPPRDRERDRDREARERDRERDRHRRDDKGEKEPKQDRDDVARPPNGPSTTVDDRSHRDDGSRPRAHLNGDDGSGGKRRRDAEESDRGSRRGPRREDRRRTMDKEPHERRERSESHRPRKERDELTSDKYDKLQEERTLSGGPPASTPSAPRQERERERDRDLRDQPLPSPRDAPLYVRDGPQHNRDPATYAREVPAPPALQRRPQSHSRDPPLHTRELPPYGREAAAQAREPPTQLRDPPLQSPRDVSQLPSPHLPTAPRNERAMTLKDRLSLESTSTSPINRQVPNPLRGAPLTPDGARNRNTPPEERDSARKRTIAEREQDGDGNAPADAPSAQKRTRIQRHRYAIDGIQSHLSPNERSSRR